MLALNPPGMFSGNSFGVTSTAAAPARSLGPAFSAAWPGTARIASEASSSKARFMVVT
jgi:hypothetical protein